MWTGPGPAVDGCFITARLPTSGTAGHLGPFTTRRMSRPVRRFMPTTFSRPCRQDRHHGSCPSASPRRRRPASIAHHRGSTMSDDQPVGLQHRGGAACSDRMFFQLRSGAEPGVVTCLRAFVAAEQVSRRAVRSRPVAGAPTTARRFRRRRARAPRIAVSTSVQFGIGAGPGGSSAATCLATSPSICTTSCAGDSAPRCSSLARAARRWGIRPDRPAPLCNPMSIHERTTTPALATHRMVNWTP